MKAANNKNVAVNLAGTGIPMKLAKEKILVTKSFLPPLHEYERYLEKIWDARWLTNCGPFATELENRLKKRFVVKHAFFVTNGTIAMQLALKALDIQGEVITTPFTFAATTNAIIWEKCTPVFVDIDPSTFSIDSSKIEEAITPNTKAILAVHVYGYPCNVKAIETIAKKHNLKVIYDAAHAFDVEIGGKSILSFGDVSTLSFHATKLFHTGEGGLIVTNNDEIAKKIVSLRNFGYVGEEVVEAGVNAKNSEIHAAMGLVNLNYIEMIKKKRRKIVEEYKRLLTNTNLHEVAYFKNVEYNYSYFPVVFESEEMLLSVFDALATQNIIPRRYFYPSLNTLSFTKYKSCPISESIAPRVACLPLYHDLGIKTVKKIVKVIIDTILSERVSLSIGIPTYNESANIEKLIHSIFSQNKSNYRLEKVYVISDGSTDNTVEKVRLLSKTYPNLRIYTDGMRKGKAARLNEIYRKNKSELLLTLDGDVLLGAKNTISLLVEKMKNNKRLNVVAGNVVPQKPGTFKEKMIYQNHIMWNNIRYSIGKTNHIANLYGSVSLLRGNFSKKVEYPTNITADEEYLYLKSYKNGGFDFEKNATVYFKTPASFSEFTKQGRRYKNERFTLAPIFGNDTLSLHKIPLKAKLRGVFISFVTAPIWTAFALAYNFYMKATPFWDDLTHSGVWEIAQSTKFNINN